MREEFKKTRFLLAEEETKFYRKLGELGIIDIDSAKYEKVRNLAFTLYLTNPLAQGIIEVMTDFVVGANEFQIQVQSEDEKLKEDLEDYIDFIFTVNELYNFREFYKELLLSGELHLPIAIEGDAIKFGFLPSSTVFQIQINSTDNRIIDKIKYRVFDKEYEYKPIRKILKRDWTYEYEGDLFYFRINRTAGMFRGYSELISMLDWLDATDQLLWNTLETSALKNVFFYIVKVLGGTEEEIKQIEQKYINTPPKAGSILVGNDKIEWEVLKNDLNLDNMNDVMRSYKNYILASKRLPEMWFAEGGYTNLATAREMSTPALKMFNSKQKEFKEMIYKITDFICYQFLKFNNLEDKILNFDILINLPSLERPEIKELSSIFTQLVNALAVSSDYGWITKEKIIEIIGMTLARLGFDIDVSALKNELIAKGEEEENFEESLIKKINEAIYKK